MLMRPLERDICNVCKIVKQQKTQAKIVRHLALGVPPKVNPIGKRFGLLLRYRRVSNV